MVSPAQDTLRVLVRDDFLWLVTAEVISGKFLTESLANRAELWYNS